MKRFIVKLSHVGLRADVMIAQKYPTYARSALLKLFDNGDVKINNKVSKPGYKLKQGDKISIDDKLLRVKIESIDLPILYEDENVIVVDKPSGVLSHSTGGLNHEASVASFIRSKVTFGSSQAGERAGIVHRLDRATSGVMICAKNPQTLSYLQKQFQMRKVTKTYVALTSSYPKEPTALIDAPISRNLKKPKTFMVNSNGKTAQTQYQVLRQTKLTTEIQLQPKTGRTHQLRVHLAYIGCPIIGDYLYGGIEAPRLMLHANKLSIRLPNGELRTFKAKMPIAFKQYLKI